MSEHGGADGRPGIKGSSLFPLWRQSNIPGEMTCFWRARLLCASDRLYALHLHHDFHVSGTQRLCGNEPPLSLRVHCLPKRLTSLPLSNASRDWTRTTPTLTPYLSTSTPSDRQTHALSLISSHRALFLFPGTQRIWSTSWSVSRNRLHSSRRCRRSWIPIRRFACSRPPQRLSK